MLKVLKRIVQDVTAAEHLNDALGILVQRINKAINAEAVSVYLIDNKNAEYVLIATEGLNKQAEFRVRVALDRGLIGLIGRREEPINLDDAPSHPDFYQNPLLGEDHLTAYLGVPIIQHRKLYGVLVAQQVEQRHFDDAEESFLITLAAQLGGIIAHAEATGELAELTQPRALGVAKVEVAQTALTGIGSVPGIGIGTAVVVYPSADIDAVPRNPAENLDDEIKVFYQALEAARDDMRRLSKRMRSTVAEEEHALFDVYLRILDDDSLGAEVEQVIRQEQISAQGALATVVKKHIALFENMEDDYLRERASDFRDLGRRVLAQLQWSQKEEIVYPKRTILIGEEVTAAALAEVPEGQLAGVVSAKGSNNSHVAILARALSIPTVMGVRGLKVEAVTRKALIVDGFYGHVYVSPSKTILTEFKLLAQEEQDLNQSLISLRDKPAETTDNYRVSLQVNTGLAMDAGLSMSVGAEGVGLYRSEVPFMSRDRFPSEDEQTIIYRQTLKAFAPHQVTMRTLDIGGDKILPYFPINEDNPYLGWRGVRVTLDHPDVFLVQVRAMMRASEELNNLRIMLPMITNLSEIEEATYLIDQAFKELLEEKCLIEKPKIGVMIEVPAAAYLTREMAKRFDLRGELTCGKDVFIDVNCVFTGRVSLGDGCIIGPNCSLTDVTLGAGCEIYANSVLEGCEIENDCHIGPFARLRSGTKLAPKCKIGNFVETKKAIFGEHSKASHLSYLGDISLGKEVNIGAGTITCNYDGVNKYQTIIEDGVFVGSDTQLIAPVTLGANATIGAGSTIRKDAPAGELTITESKQKTVPGWKRPPKKHSSS